MTEDTIAWLSSARGHGLLAMIHMGGMLLVAGAAVLGYGIAARLLYQRGRPPVPIFVNALHGLIAIGLAMLWLTGGALALGRISFTELPAPMLFKLSVAALLSVCVWAEHAMARPWLLSAHRPLAANLGWGQLIGIAVIGALSLSCWAMLIAGNYLPELQAMPLDRSFVLLGFLVAVIVTGSLTLALVTRGREAKRRPRSAKKRRTRTGQPRPVAPQTASRRPQPRPRIPASAIPQPQIPQSPMPHMSQQASAPVAAPAPVVLLSRQPPAAVPQPAAAPAPVAAPSPSAPAQNYQVPQGRTDDAEQLRYKLAREWLRCTPAPPVSSAWNAGGSAEPDDRLLQDWLRRPQS